MVWAVLVLGGIPLLLFLAHHGGGLHPVAGPRRADRAGSAAGQNQWLGGPRTGTAELEGPESEDADAGGASGRW